MQIVTTKEFNEARINEITGTIRQLKRINRDIWELIPELQAHVEKAGKPEAG